MTENRRVIKATASTHSDAKVTVPDSEFEVENSQSGAAQLLIDPEESKNVSTHSQDEPKVVGVKKAPTTASMSADTVTDEELEGPVNTHDSETGDSLIEEVETEDLPVMEVPAAVEEAEDVPGGEDDGLAADEDFLEEEESVEAEFDDEFADLPAIETDAELDEDQEDSEAEITEAYEVAADDAETVSLVDADETADTIEDEDDLQFATIANVVHVIHSNRIIASMGAATAKKVKASDVYLTPQFQDVVAASISAKGLRKGLVQSGFVLARVKLAAASKSTTKAVQAKVSASVAKQVALVASREKAMEQSLAIAAVGINRRFFKDTQNELKANLEAELVQLGVRGGQNVVRAAFAQYGVSYAKAILTLAKKIAAMPQEMRDSYVDALDMTEGGDEGEDLEAELADDEFMEDEGTEDNFDELPASTVTAALSRNAQPRRNVAALLSAGVKTTAALSILNGSQSLV